MLKNELGKKNNAGFTLLEVLVAVIILSVISVPLLRSFATAAQTNSRAKIEALCTNAAENVAEDFRDVKANLLVEKYIGRELEESDYNAADNKYEYEELDSSSEFYGNKAEVDDDGVYTFTIKNQNTMSSKMPEGYYAQVTLDPSLYKNSNGLNLSQVEPVSIKNSAIYTMDDSLDSEVYKHFVNKNKVLDSGYTKWSADKFKQNLTRTITFDINKTGERRVDKNGKLISEGSDPVEGETTVDICTVYMTITYKLAIDNANAILPTKEQTYEAHHDLYFDNSKTGRPLDSIYLFFYPRYAAGIAKKEGIGQPGYDRIIVNNEDNIECNLYITMMKGAADENLMEAYCKQKALGVSVVENPASDAKKAAITLRTNMNSGVPYSKTDDSPDKGVQYMTLSYGNKVGTIKKFNTDAGKLLSIANTDGKTLNVTDTPNRIYKMKVEIIDPNNTKTITEPDGTEVVVNNAIVEFDGTKLEY